MIRQAEAGHARAGEGAASGSPTRLLIISHVIHYRYAGRLHAYAAYAREIDLWADLFPQVLIASPLRDERPPGDCAPFERSNVSIDPQPETGGTTASAKAWQVLRVPYLVYRLLRSVAGADAIHVRCPGNLGLLGALVAPLGGVPVVAKYAGNWIGYPGEPWSLRFQRAVLRSRWWRGPVTVYGEWPGQPEHVVPFFTSVMTGAQVARARGVAARRRLGACLRLLYVGRLAPNKNVDVLVEALAELRGRGLPVECAIVGDGPARANLELLVAERGMAEWVRFVGAIPFDEVQRWYEWGDVLVLASDAEGWPKAIAEAMAYGLVCIGADRGFIPRMLSDGRGILVQPGDRVGLVDAIVAVMARPDQHLDMGARAAVWAHRYSLEGLRAAIGELLSERWRVDVRYRPDPAPPVLADEPG